MHKDDRWPCSARILLPYLFPPSPLTETNKHETRTPRTNMAASAAVGLQTAAVSAHALRRPAPRWPLPQSARPPRVGRWCACCLSASQRHGCRLRASDCNSRLPVLASQRSFPCWKLGGAGESCGVNVERDRRASAPASSRRRWPRASGSRRQVGRLEGPGVRVGKGCGSGGPPSLRSSGDGGGEADGLGCRRVAGRAAGPGRAERCAGAERGQGKGSGPGAELPGVGARGIQEAAFFMRLCSGGPGPR